METVISHYSEPVCRETAKQAGLRYIRDDVPGISRKRAGKGFVYYYPDSRKVDCRDTLARIRALVLPPAYRSVWICPYDNGHLQATGIDSKNRKQYRYHPEWLAARAVSKFDRLLAFGAALPTIRERIMADLGKPGLPREKVLAALVSIMDQSYVRVGNDIYTQEHNTYGLTTLRKKHVNVEGDRIEMVFNGKNLTPWHISLKDRKLARVLKQCEEIPGYRIFKYRDESGEKQDVNSQDLNAYLKEITGEPFTAKDFRTWAACYEAFQQLLETPRPEAKAAQKKALHAVVKKVADVLGHTQAVCKKAYLHPLLLEVWMDNRLHEWRKAQREKDMQRLFMKWWKAHLAA